MNHWMLAIIATSLFGPLAAYADARWVKPPVQRPFTDFKEFEVIFDQTNGLFHRVRANGGWAGPSAAEKVRRLRLTAEFDGDETNVCFGTLEVDGKKSWAVCVLSRMQVSSCSKVEAKKCAEDDSIAEALPRRDSASMEKVSDRVGNKAAPPSGGTSSDASTSGRDLKGRVAK